MDDTEPSQQAPTTTDELDNQIAALETKLGKSEAPKPEKSKAETEAQLTAELGAIYDKAEAKAEQEAARQTVPQTAKNLDEAFSNTAEWFDKSASERKTLQDGHTAVADLKARAAQMGVTLDDKDAAMLALQLEQRQPQAAPAVPAELQASMQAVQQLYPDQPAHQMIGRYAEIDRLVKADPIQGVAWIAEQAGMNPLQLAQGLAVRFGDQQQVLANAENLVADWFASNLGSEALQAEMQAAIESGKVKRTGSISRDLHSALKYAQNQQRQKKARHARSSDAKIRDSMEEAYQRMAKR